MKEEITIRISQNKLYQLAMRSGSAEKSEMVKYAIEHTMNCPFTSSNLAKALIDAGWSIERMEELLAEMKKINGGNVYE